MSAAIYAIIKCDTVDILGTWLGPNRRGPAWRALRHRVHPPPMSSRLSCVWSTNKRNERNGRRLRVAAREVMRKPSRRMYSRHDAYIQTAPLLCLYGEQRAIASA